MEFKIKPPFYYGSKADYDIEIITMNNKITNYMIDKNYCEDIKHIHILPMIISSEMQFLELWKEMASISSAENITSVFKYIEYNTYRVSSIEKRKQMIVDCILDSVKMIEKETNGKFDFKAFKKDLLIIVNDNQAATYEYVPTFAIL